MVGILLSIIAALSVVMLMGLSGWFITTAGVIATLSPAGLVGFNFLQPAAQIRALAIVRTLCRYGERLVNHDVSLRVLTDLRSWFFNKLIPIVPAGLGKFRSGDVLLRITQDIDRLDAVYLQGFVPSMVALVLVGTTLYFIYGFAPEISVVVLVLSVVPGLLLPYLAYRQTLSSAFDLSQSAANLKSSVIDAAQGVGELTVYAADQRCRSQIDAVSRRCIKLQSQHDRFAAFCTTIAELTRHLALLSALLIGGLMVESEFLSGPHWVMLLLGVLTLFDFVIPLSGAYRSMAQSEASVARIQSLEQISDWFEKEKTDYEKLGPDKFDIDFENISFNYPASDSPILRQINLVVPEGRRIAIVGENGAGKTTLLNLLTGFYAPLSGFIRFGGRDIAGLDPDKLLRDIGVLTQESRLLEATLKDNLLIGDPLASEPGLNKVLVEVGLSHFVHDLSDGLETWVGEEGQLVSGGESRRICLARVMLKNAPILILDEPANGLDFDSEQRLWLCLDSFMVGKTVILVTHRTTGIALMDDVYVLSEGRIARRMSPADYIAIRSYSG